MKNKILLILSFLFIPFVSAEMVYKSFDAEGNIIFSDEPSMGAEVIEIEKAQTINIPKVKKTDYRSTTKLAPEEKEYTRLKIVSPENDVTIRSNVGNVSVNVELVPALFEDDILVLFMDGKEVSSGTTTQFSLSNLERGTHNIDVAVKNEEGKVLKRSDKLVFHLRKYSKLFEKPKAETPKTVVNPLPATPENTNKPPATGIPVS